uniref:Uncharacterized protein n=1 Tax=Avena sativa TaxID=4498 RepID=A0ACD5WVI1_AVESA
MAGGAAPPSTARGGYRLSALNDDLLQEIITCLPVKEAARTVVLAKRWRYLWPSAPLFLNDADLPQPARDVVVPRVLAEHRGRFRSINLAYFRLASLDRELPGWPRLLADKRTQRLQLTNRNYLPPNQIGTLPHIPADILRCGSLQNLVLGFLKFPVDLSHGVEIFLPNLRELTLAMVIISGEDLEHLITACTALKTLKLTSLTPKRVHLRSRSLRCALVGLSRVEDFAVVDAPLLERLVLYLPGTGARVKIGYAANLLVLGHLDTRVHQLQIRDMVIKSGLKPNTMASTSTLIPSVKILAVTVNFGVLSELNTLASFLRCFPNIVTLHIESVLHDPSVSASAIEPSGEHHAKFWQEVGPVECLRSHVLEKMAIHEFRGDQDEFEFLKFVAMNAQGLQSLHVVLQEGDTSSSDDKKVNEAREKLQDLRFQTGISGVLLVLPKEGILSTLQKATDLTYNDPFRF